MVALSLGAELGGELLCSDSGQCDVVRLILIDLLVVLFHCGLLKIIIGIPLVIGPSLRVRLRNL